MKGNQQQFLTVIMMLVLIFSIGVVRQKGVAQQFSLHFLPVTTVLALAWVVVDTQIIQNSLIHLNRPDPHLILECQLCAKVYDPGTKGKYQLDFVITTYKHHALFNH
jgi:hypothetical protein